MLAGESRRAACPAPAEIASQTLDCPLTRALLLCTCIVALLAVDQASKVYARQHWRGTSEEPLVYLGGLFRIQYAENPGAFLSLLGGVDPQVRFWLLTVGNGLILAAVAGYLLLGKLRELWTWSALAMIAGGGIGNLIDRVRFDCHVIDFLLLTTVPVELPVVGALRTGIFNVADIAITAGFLMLVPTVFRSTPPADSPAPAA